MTRGTSTTSDSWTLHLGDQRDVLRDLVVDAIVSDPPYGARTHDATVERCDETGRTEGLTPSYSAWTSDDVSEFVQSWSPRCRGWMVTQTSHELIPAWESAYASVDRYCFAPIPCVMRGMSVRMLGDGPSSWTVYAIVARPRTREFASWGTLDGAYTGPRGSEAGGGRGKPMWLVNALVRDYTKPNDLVCDPFAGWGTTIAAALANGRRAIGAEVNINAYNEAIRRLSRSLQTDIFGGAL